MPVMILFGNLWEGMIVDPGFYSWDSVSGEGVYRFIRV